MGGLPSRRKGATFEAAVASWFRRNGFPCAERRSSGAAGTDILGLVGFSVECKNHADVATALRLGVDQAVEESDWRTTLPVAIVKRPRIADVGRAYAVMPLESWIQLARQAGYGDRLPDDGGRPG